jgi:protein SCO1/2
MRILILLFMFLLLPGSADTLEVGDVVPDFQLTNQNGENVRLQQYRGKVVLVTFLYTQCPFPEKCPMISSKLGKTRKLIEDVTEGTDKLQVISITIDPENDTPEALKAYSQGLDREVPNWTFLTGSPENVARVASQFGVLYWDEKGIIEHNMRTIVIDQEGRIDTVLKGSDWKAGQLAAQLKELVK